MFIFVLPLDTRKPVLKVFCLVAAAIFTLSMLYSLKLHASASISVNPFELIETLSGLVGLFAWWGLGLGKEIGKPSFWKPFFAISLLLTLWLLPTHQLPGKTPGHITYILLMNAVFYIGIFVYAFSTRDKKPE